MVLELRLGNRLRRSRVVETSVLHDSCSRLEFRNGERVVVMMFDVRVPFNKIRTRANNDALYGRELSV